MSDLEEQEATAKEACSGLKAELISCLSKSDCMKKVRKNTFSENPGYIASYGLFFSLFYEMTKQ